MLPSASHNIENGSFHMPAHTVSLQTDLGGDEGQINNFLLIEDRNKWTQGVAHNYKMSETQMSCKWDG